MGHGHRPPALHVPGYVEPCAPIFASAGANGLLATREQRGVLLLPFVNQGALRGEYRAFMNDA